MNILLLTAYFPPEIGSASHLFYELGLAFSRRGHAVTVLTGFPVYNVKSAELPERYRRGWLLREQSDGLNIVRVRALGMPRHIPVLRGIGQFTFSVAAAVAGLFSVGGRKDVVLVYSPPLFLGLSALTLRFFLHTRVVLNIQDLFPQSAIDLGVLKNRFLISVFRSVERLLYRRSDVVTVHSEGNKKHVEQCGGNAVRAVVVTNPVDTQQLRPGPRLNEFRRRRSIGPEDFVVSFAGVLGLSQDLDSVIDAARLLSEVPNILFYIVGDGMEKERLMRKAAGLPRVIFLPMLGREEYAELLHASDVCLATLRKEVRTPVVPSKILSIMAAGRPVLASMPLEGDAPRLIEDSSCGICVPPGRPEELARAVRELYADRRRCEQLGNSGREYVERHFSLDRCAAFYEEVFETALQEQPGKAQ